MNAGGAAILESSHKNGRVSAFGTSDFFAGCGRRTRRPWLFTAGVFGGDFAIWTVAYLGFTAILGGKNQYNWVDVALPLFVSILALALVGGYNPRAKMASLKYATEHLIACVGGYLLAAFGIYVVATFGGGIASSRAVLTTSFLIFAVGTSRPAASGLVRPEPIPPQAPTCW